LTGNRSLPRILDGDIDRLLNEISRVRLAEASGLDLTRQGKEHLACCPFHEDQGTSLILDADNRWRCTGCGASGDLVDWVVRRSGVRVARRHFRDRNNRTIEFPDLCQLAFAGLLEAIDRFDPDYGVSFSHFAERRITGSVLDGVLHASDSPLRRRGKGGASS
jgi:hypothetical protein